MKKNLFEVEGESELFKVAGMEFDEKGYFVFEGDKFFGYYLEEDLAMEDVYIFREEKGRDVEMRIIEKWLVKYLCVDGWAIYFSGEFVKFLENEDLAKEYFNKFFKFVE